MPKPGKNPADVASKWSRNLAGATDSIKAGVNAVTVAPGAAAAEKADLYLQRVQEAVKKWQAALRKVSLADWQKATIDKGLQRIAAGAAAAKPKFESFYRDFNLALGQVDSVLSNFPRGGLQQNIQRAVKTIETLAEWGRNRRAGQ